MEYVTSVRGLHGGYRLAKPTDTYTLGIIHRITERSLCPAACLEEVRAPCPRQDGNAALRLWTEINDAIRDVVDKYTLTDLIEWQQQGMYNCVI